MLAVIFKVLQTVNGKEEYLKMAAELREFLESGDGFISSERFQKPASGGWQAFNGQASYNS